MKKALLVLFALMLVVCLTSCGDPEEIGTYELDSMTEDGETMSMKDLKDMYAAYGMDMPEFSLTLTKDGKGKLVAAGEASDITWDSKAKTMTNNGETISYTFKDNKITLSDEGQAMVFVKKN